MVLFLEMILRTYTIKTKSETTTVKPSTTKSTEYNTTSSFEETTTNDVGIKNRVFKYMFAPHSELC